MRYNSPSVSRSKVVGLPSRKQKIVLCNEGRMRFCLLSWIVVWINCAAWTLVFGNRHRLTQGRTERRQEQASAKADVASPEEAKWLTDYEYQLKVDAEADGCIFYGPYLGYIPGCFDKCSVEQDFDAAKAKCAASSKCGGFIEKLADMQPGYEFRHGPNFMLNEEGREQSWIKVCDGSGKPHFGEQQDLAEFRIQQWRRPWTRVVHSTSQIRETSDGVDTILFPREQDWTRTGKHCWYAEPEPGYLGGCIQHEEGGCVQFLMFFEAQEACDSQNECKGITMAVYERYHPFTIRTDTKILESPREEYSWIKECTTNVQSLAGPQPGYPLLSAKEKALNQIGTFVNGRPTVYVTIASYRDAWCKNSVTTAFSNAVYPERIFVGVSQQNSDDDEPCVDPNICDKDSEHVLCKYRDHIRINRIDAKTATGPVFGRYHADRLYRGEYFAVSIDAHMVFVPNWDVRTIAMWRSIGNEMALITTYPEDLSKAEKKGFEEITSWSMICAATFQHEGTIRNNRGMLVIPPFSHRNRPILQPFLGAGIVFSRGHRVLRAPNDCCVPGIFNGEEFNVATRSWTAGYDIYCPSMHIAFHPYQRKKRPPMFQENYRPPDEKRKARNRLGHISEFYFGDDYNKEDLEKYGLGNVRPMSRFNEIFGIFPESKEIVNNCDETITAKLHDRLHVFLRRDGLGIDYGMVPHYSRRPFEKMSKPDAADKKKRKEKK